MSRSVQADTARHWQTLADNFGALYGGPLGSPYVIFGPRGPTETFFEAKIQPHRTWGHMRACVLTLAPYLNQRYFVVSCSIKRCRRRKYESSVRNRKKRHGKGQCPLAMASTKLAVDDVVLLVCGVLLFVL